MKPGQMTTHITTQNLGYLVVGGSGRNLIGISLHGDMG